MCASIPTPDMSSVVNINQHWKPSTCGGPAFGCDWVLRPGQNGMGGSPKHLPQLFGQALTQPPLPKLRIPNRRGEGNRMRRGACALPPSAPRTEPSPPPAGACHCRPSTEGALTSLAISPANSPSWSPWSRPRRHRPGQTAPRGARDRGARARPSALRRRRLSAASVCSGQRKSRVVPESAAVLLGPARSAPAALDQTAPRTPCPGPQP